MIFFKKIPEWIIEKMGDWLAKQQPASRAYLCNFKKICEEIKPSDVLLIEGRSKASRIIKQVTQSPWSHAALYIGRLHDIKNDDLKNYVKNCVTCDEDTQLLVESEIGLGTVISPIEKYKDDHIRVVRADSLTEEDSIKVINFAIGRLGRKYNLRHLLDLMRFLFPWNLYPRRWRSSLFQHNALQPTEDICSSMIANAFQSIRYPILPLVIESGKNKLELIRRNPRLFTPSDFDYSPYFLVIKYPIFPLGIKGDYANLPWKEGVISDDQGSKLTPHYKKNAIHNSLQIKLFFSSDAYAVVGASSNESKFGNKVLRCYLQHQMKVSPVNPNEKNIAGVPCVKTIVDLPDAVKSISIVTPPLITEKIVDEAILKEIKNIWMQPGAESPLAIEKCKQHHINVIAQGPCILVELGFDD